MTIEKIENIAEAGGQKTKIDKLFLFDFDDTLAHTENFVNVTFIDKETGESEGQENLDSYSFEKYRQSPEEDRESDILDFDDFDNVRNPVPISSVLILMSSAIDDPDSYPAIITARPSTSKQGISLFLNSNNISIPQNDINTVGDIGGKPEHKLAVAKQYVMNLSPKEVHFFDDSKKNNDAIITMCGDISDDLQVFTYDIISGIPKLDSTCDSIEQKRMMEIAGII